MGMGHKWKLSDRGNRSK